MKYIDLNLSWIKSIMKLRPVPTNAGNEIQSCVGMLKFISI